jgi:hypothetical protein
MISSVAKQQPKVQTEQKTESKPKPPPPPPAVKRDGFDAAPKKSPVAATPTPVGSSGSTGIASSLATEVIGDGKKNCLENAFRMAGPKDRIVLCQDNIDGVGHALIQHPNGTVTDPSDPNTSYTSTQDWVDKQEKDRFTVVGDVSRSDLAQVFATAPGPSRDQVLRQLGLDKIGSVQVAGGGAVNPAIFPYPPPASTPAEALQKLEAMRDYWAAQPPPQNRMGVFPTAYIEMTNGLMARAAQYRAAGNTAQANAIEAMVVPFANEYFKAFSAYQAQQPQNQPAPAGVPTTVPQAWQVHFAEANNPNAPMATLLATAMNAHILYDLPRVLKQLNDSGVPGYAINSQADFERNRAAFLEYSDTFAQAGGAISSALQQYYGANDVTTAATIAKAFGVDELGVGSAVFMMRETAFNVARTLLYRDLQGDTSFGPAQLDAWVAGYSRRFADQISSAMANIASPTSAGTAAAAALNALWTMDQLSSLPTMVPVPKPTPPTAQPSVTGTPPANINIPPVVIDTPTPTANAP